jgi:phosphate transport system ATP-binding protein
MSIETQKTVERTGVGVNVKDVNIFYGKKQAVRNVNMHIEANRITALIGPSGCGKSTLLRSMNRMIETIPGGRVDGQINLGEKPVYGNSVDAALIRQKIGMVFQRPNPFPALSIRENVISGLVITGETNQKKLEQVAEDCLRRAYLWDEVHDKLDAPGTSLSGGQQQRLCIARTIAVEPEVILMDEPCSALDPISTLRVEDLMLELKRRYTIIIVTHNMQQAARVSDKTAFMLAGEERIGELVEFTETKTLFTKPKDERTERYISGMFS